MRISVSTVFWCAKFQSRWRSFLSKFAPWSISKWQCKHSAATKLSSALMPRPLPPPQFVCAACTIWPDPQHWQSRLATNFSSFLLLTYSCFFSNYSLQGCESVHIGALNPAAAGVASFKARLFHNCPCSALRALNHRQKRGISRLVVCQRLWITLSVRSFPARSSC